MTDLSIKLWPHQQRIVDSDPKKSLLCWEMRTGKSLPATIWAKKRYSCLIVCPKQLVKSWQKEAPFAVIMSKEQFKKSPPTAFNSLIIDEAHTFASPLFTKGRSQLATAMYEFIKTNPNMDVMLLTATPIRNDPSSLHTLLCYMGIYIEWKKWRQEFYSLEYRPYLPRPAWMPRPDWRIKIRTYLEKYADIVSLRDCVNYLPPATTEIIEVDKPQYQPSLEPKWTDEHLNEQSFKPEAIIKLSYRKLIIVAHYTAQIDSLKDTLEKEKPVFVLDGRTKNSHEVIKDAQGADDCYFIVQASMGVGFDGYMFPALVFASMSHRALDHTQMLGRLRHIQDLHPVMHYYLIGGKWDKRIYESIIKNQDFNPHIYKYETA